MSAVVDGVAQIRYPRHHESQTVIALVGTDVSPISLAFYVVTTKVGYDSH